MYYPVGQIFAQNCYISYCFRDIPNFLFSAKIQDGRQKWQKLTFQRILLYTTLWVKNSLEIALSFTVSKIFSMFCFPLKFKMAAKCRKLKIFPFAQDTLVLPCGSKIQLKSLYLFRFSRYLQFVFSAKIQDGCQKFSPRHKILLYHSTGQKFARNRSISYHFRDIFNVLFSAKIQHGCQKWRKSKFLPRIL